MRNRNGNHTVEPPPAPRAEYLKLTTRYCDNVPNGTQPSPGDDNHNEEGVSVLGTSSRIQNLISAAIRVWELKRGIR